MKKRTWCREHQRWHTVSGGRHLAEEARRLAAEGVEMKRRLWKALQDKVKP